MGFGIHPEEQRLPWAWSHGLLLGLPSLFLLGIYVGGAPSRGQVDLERAADLPAVLGMPSVRHDGIDLPQPREHDLGGALQYRVHTGRIPMRCPAYQGILGVVDK